MNFPLGQQSGYTKYPCFICLYDCRAHGDHWEKLNWPLREMLPVGTANIIRKPLVDRFFFNSYQTGIMEQFVKGLHTDDDCFQHICKMFLN